MLKSIPITARWTRSNLPLLLEMLARHCGAPPHHASLEPPDIHMMEAGDIGNWIEAACARLGLEADRQYVSLSDVPSSIMHAAPAIFVLPDGEFVGLAGVRRGMARLITGDLRTIGVPIPALRDALCTKVEANFKDEVDALLQHCRSAVVDQDRLRRAVVQKRAGSVSLMLGWQVRLPSGSSFRRQLTRAGLHGQAWKFGTAYIVEALLTMGSWLLLGRAALTGVFDTGWLIAWVLMMICALAFRTWRSAISQAMSVVVSGLLKQRLIAGAVRVDADSVRHEGAGGMLARVIETEAIESLAIGGCLAVMTAPLELALAGALLWLGAGGVLHVLLLAVWAGILSLLVWRQQTCRAAWMNARLAMTEDLVEQMNGHRTRVLEENPARRHEAEDRRLEQYLERSAELDKHTVRVNTLMPRLWLLVGLGALAPAFIRGSTPDSLAISIAAVLLAQASLGTLGPALSSLASAALAWRKVKPLFQAAEQRPEQGSAAIPARVAGGILLEARDLTFRYRERSEPIVRGCNLTIRPHDHILLEGASGEGKSTLASLLAGLRTPESGLLLAGRLDRYTLGEAQWRERVALVPQSHENHIFSASLAFNLLMGRAWPPRQEDLSDAWAVCEDLGLNPLLARMPAGLDQMVGESGWQLSEGERSRVFLARALLSRADVLILDECWATLDPKSLTLAYQALRRRAKAILMVAHP